MTPAPPRSTLPAMTHLDAAILLIELGILAGCALIATLKRL